MRGREGLLDDSRGRVSLFTEIIVFFWRGRGGSCVFCVEDHCWVMNCQMNRAILEVVQFQCDEGYRSVKFVSYVAAGWTENKDDP